MTVAIIYHSVSGHTREVAEYLADTCDGMLIEIVGLTHYNPITRYIIGSKRAMNGEKDDIDPAMIDAVDALRGCEEKEAVIYATCGAVAGDTLELLQSALEQKGARVTGRVIFTQQELQSEEKRKELLSLLGASCAQ
jgi:flavodoxin